MDFHISGQAAAAREGARTATGKFGHQLHAPSTLTLTAPTDGFGGLEHVVDRSLSPVDGSVVVAVIDGELTIKRLRLERGRVRLAAENPDYQDVIVPELSELTIWGVVTRCLHHI